MSPDTLVTPLEAEHLTRVSVRTLRRMHTEGTLTPHRYGRRTIRYRLGDLLQIPTDKDN